MMVDTQAGEQSRDRRVSTVMVRSDPGARRKVFEGIQELWRGLDLSGWSEDVLVKQLTGQWDQMAVSVRWNKDAASVQQMVGAASRDNAALLAQEYNLLLELAAAYAGVDELPAYRLSTSSMTRVFPTQAELLDDGLPEAATALDVLGLTTTSVGALSQVSTKDVTEVAEPTSEAAPGGESDGAEETESGPMAEPENPSYEPIAPSETVLDRDEVLAHRQARRKQWRAYREQQYELLGSSVTAEEFWDEGVDADGGENPVAATVSAEVYPGESLVKSTGMAADKAGSVGRVNRALLVAAQQLVTDRLRDNGVVLRNKDGLVPQNVLIHALLLQLLGDQVDVEVSEVNRLVGIAAGIGDRRYDEVTAALDDVDRQVTEQGESLTQMRRVVNEQSRSLDVLTRLTATMFAERLDVLRIPVGGGVSAVHADASSVTDLIDQVARGADRLARKEAEKQGRLR